MPQLSIESLKEEASGTGKAVFLESVDTGVSTDGGDDHFSVRSVGNGYSFKKQRLVWNRLSGLSHSCCMM